MLESGVSKSSAGCSAAVRVLAVLPAQKPPAAVSVDLQKIGGIGITTGNGAAKADLSARADRRRLTRCQRGRHHGAAGPESDVVEGEVIAWQAVSAGIIVEDTHDCRGDAGGKRKEKAIVAPGPGSQFRHGAGIVGVEHCTVFRLNDKGQVGKDRVRRMYRIIRLGYPGRELVFTAAAKRGHLLPEKFPDAGTRILVKHIPVGVTGMVLATRMPVGAA